MYYEKIEGNASNEWILFIHGLGGSIKTWKRQLNHRILSCIDTLPKKREHMLSFFIK